MSSPGTADFYESYLDEQTMPYPFCPGCGHGGILDQLDSALVKLQLDPKKVVIVTDIGCAGLSDRFFKTNAFHGLHGRSLTYGTGMKLANPELNVIVLIGDGGCGIGGHHLINAARRNIGLTVFVFNNLNYGMTGGEHSVTTPLGATTTTTPFGNLERPLDICSTAGVNGASFVARTTSYDKGLSDLMAQAIQHEGFSLVDIWELCVAYYVPNNRFNRTQLEETMDRLGFSRGVLHVDERDEYSEAYRTVTAGLRGLEVAPVMPLEPKFAHTLNSPIELIIAGAAGMRIATAAGLFSRGSVLAGLWATQRNDYPITVRSGFSLSEVMLSPESNWLGDGQSNRILVILFPEGLKKLRSQLAELRSEDRVYIQKEFLPLKTHARLYPLDFGPVRRKSDWSIAAIGEVLRHSGIFPIEALREAIKMHSRFSEESLKVIDSSLGKLVTALD